MFMCFHVALTASIDPKGMFVRLADVNERRKQYLDGLRAVLANPDPIIAGVTFLENTGSDLEAFHELTERCNPHGKPLEILGLNLNDYPRRLGVGYGEFQLLDAGMGASRLLGAGNPIVKLTGRLQVKNLSAILHALPADVEMAADVKVKGDYAHGWCESRLIVFSHNFYQRRIVGMYKDVDGSRGVTAEHCLYQVVRRSAGSRIVSRLPREPLWVGSSGSTGQRYDSLSMRIRHPLRVAWRAMCRRAGVPDVRAIWASAEGAGEALGSGESPAVVAN